MQEKNLKCFIVTQIGENDSDIRRHADGVIESALEPVLQNNGIELFVSHRMANPGSITRQILAHILEDDLVVANLTNLNPNVMYELAVRHAVRKPIILICEIGTKLPFDITDERTIFYTNDMKGVVELKDSFARMLNEALNDSKPDNPIYRATNEMKILEDVNIDSSEKSLEKYIIQRLGSIEETISTIKNQSNARIPHFERKGTEYKFTFRVVKELSYSDFRKMLLNSSSTIAVSNFHWIESKVIKDPQTTLIPDEIYNIRFKLFSIKGFNDFRKLTESDEFNEYIIPIDVEELNEN